MSDQYAWDALDYTRLPDEDQSGQLNWPLPKTSDPFNLPGSRLLTTASHNHSEKTPLKK